MKIAMAVLFVMSVSCAVASGPPPSESDLWILAGQSNMQGYGVLCEQAKPDPRIMMLNMDNQWMIAQEPLHRLYAAVAPVHRNLMIASGCTPEQFEKRKAQSKNQSESGVGPGLFFAQHLVDNGIRAMGLIPCAHGGTSMDQWSPDLKDQGDQSLYGAMLNRVKVAGGKIKGVLWYQGEAETDANLCQVYQVKMLNFIDNLRHDVNDVNLPFLCVQIGRLRYNGLAESQMRAWEKMRDVQLSLMSLRKNVYMITAADLPLDDLVHLSFEGQRRLGRRLAEAALTHVYGKAEHGGAIDVESIEAFNDAKPTPYIKVRFKGVSGRLSSNGRPSDFDLLPPLPIDSYMVAYRTDYDPDDPSALLIRVQKPITDSVKLLYGQGEAPYMNIVDQKDMAVPAFGPRTVTIH